MGVTETDAFEKLLNKMTILSADKVALDVEIVEQIEDVNAKYTHRVCMHCVTSVSDFIACSLKTIDGHGQL